MEAQGLLTCSQEPSIKLHPEPHDSNFSPFVPFIQGPF
jgi:hypothetical protein